MKKLLKNKLKERLRERLKALQAKQDRKWLSKRITYGKIYMRCLAKAKYGAIEHGEIRFVHRVQARGNFSPQDVQDFAHYLGLSYRFVKSIDGRPPMSIISWR